jgi:hypothetical protein
MVLMTRQHFDALNYALSCGKVMLLAQIADYKKNGYDASAYEDFLARNLAARQALHELASQMSVQEWLRREAA